MPRYALRGVKFARVDFSPIFGFGSLRALVERPTAETPFTGRTAIDHDVAVQACTALMVQRNAVTMSYRGTMVLFEKASGNFVRTEAYYKAGEAVERAAEYERDGKLVPLPLLGLDPLFDLSPGSGPVPKWGPTLALALDQCVRRIAKSETSTSPGGAEVIPAIEPLSIGTIAVIVGGVAVAVIGGIAAYRFLEPSARVQIAAVEAATLAYQERLAVFEKTGQMPSVSEIERANAASVVEAAKSSGRADWIVTGAAVGGTAVGATLASVVLK